MKNIYIVLIKAHTGLGKLAKTITKYDYTHIAVCFDNKLTEFITYSRRRHYLCPYGLSHSGGSSVRFGGIPGLFCTAGAAASDAVCKHAGIPAPHHRGSHEAGIPYGCEDLKTRTQCVLAFFISEDR